MSVGLDLSQNCFRSLRRDGDRLIARSCRPVYAIVQDNPARRGLFFERGVPVSQFNGNLILFGDTAGEWADRLRVSVIPLCMQGRLQFDDAVIRQVTACLIEALLPFPDDRPGECCLTLPGGLHQEAATTSNHLQRMIGQLGYRPQVTSASLAVALAELSPWGVSGISLYLGDRSCELSVVRHGCELAHLEIPHQPIGLPAGDGDALSLDNSLRSTFATVAFELNRRPEWKALPMPIPVAICGDLMADERMTDQIAVGIHHASWPFSLGAVRLSTDPAWTVSRGCLIQAELEKLTAVSRAA